LALALPLGSLGSLGSPAAGCGNAFIASGGGGDPIKKRNAPPKRRPHTLLQAHFPILIRIPISAKLTKVVKRLSRPL